METVCQRTMVRWGALLGVLVACAAGLRAQASDTGSVVRVRTVRVGIGGDRASRAAGVGLLIQRLGARQRVDVLRDLSDTTGSDWILSDSTPRTFRINSTAGRTSMVMRFTDLQTLFTSVLHAEFDSVANEVEVLGAGPRLLGYDTQRVRFRRRFRMRTTRGGATQRVTVTSETDALIAPDVPESFGANSAVSLTSSGTASLVGQIFGQAMAQPRVRGGGGVVPTGLALRSATRSTTHLDGAMTGPFPFSPGDTVTRLDSVEVLAIERRPLDPARFAPPDGYREVDFGRMMQDLVQAMDSLGAALKARPGMSAKPINPNKGPGKPIDKPRKP